MQSVTKHCSKASPPIRDMIGSGCHHRHPIFPTGTQNRECGIPFSIFLLKLQHKGSFVGLKVNGS